jgi:hypothetical protein
MDAAELARRLPLKAVDEIPAEHLPAVMIYLTAVQGRLATRLAVIPPAVPPVVDALLDVDAAAELLGRSPSWMRKRGRTLPGFVQPTGRGGRVHWARAALVAWRDGIC